MSLSALQLQQVRDTYLNSLRDFVDPTRDRIHLLTDIAAESVDAAQAITDAIVDRLRHVSPSLKLPLVYLIDSIVKNVAGIYVHLFAKSIAILFVETYEKVDENTRMSLDKVLRTWHCQPPPNQGSVFPLQILDDLERRKAALFHSPTLSQRLSAISLPVSSIPSAVSSLPFARDDVSALTNDILHMLDYRWNLKQIAPLDNDNNQKMAALEALLSLVQSGQVPFSQLDMMRDTLSSLRVNTSQSLPNLPVTYSFLPPTTNTLASLTTNTIGLSNSTLSSFPLLSYSSPTTHLMTTTVNTVSSLASDPRLSSISHSSLGSTNILTSTISSNNELFSTFPMIRPQSAAAANATLRSLADASMNNYCRVDITDAEQLNRLNPLFVDLIYSARSKKCRQCGQRFTDVNGEEAQRIRIDAHMDWHFRVNKRRSFGVKSIQSRLWFSDADDWVMNVIGDEHKDTKGVTFFDLQEQQERKLQRWQTTANGGANSNDEESLSSDDTGGNNGRSSNNGGDGEAVKVGSGSDSDTTSTMVESIERKCIAPANAATALCNVCKENFPTVWDEDEEEWVLKGAIRYQEQYYHIKCWQDSRKKRHPAIATTITSVKRVIEDDNINHDTLTNKKVKIEV